MTDPKVERDTYIPKRFTVPIISSNRITIPQAIIDTWLMEKDEYWTFEVVGRSREAPKEKVSTT